MEHTSIPQDELDLFESLQDIRVVFDVGARSDDEYVKIKPDVELHAFEPNPAFFEELSLKLKDRPNTYLNNFGLADYTGNMLYNEGRQCFVGGEEVSIKMGTLLLELKTLDDYVREHGIEQIDFLKIDTEGYDFRVLLGGLETLKKCRYIQYEHWNDKRRFHILLGQQFEMKPIGNRNIFCTRL